MSDQPPSEQETQHLENQKSVSLFNTFTDSVDYYSRLLGKKTYTWLLDAVSPAKESPHDAADLNSALLYAPPELNQAAKNSESTDTQLLQRFNNEPERFLQDIAASIKAKNLNDAFKLLFIALRGLHSIENNQQTKLHQHCLSQLVTCLSLAEDEITCRRALAQIPLLDLESIYQEILSKGTFHFNYKEFHWLICDDLIKSFNDETLHPFTQDNRAKRSELLKKSIQLIIKTPNHFQHFQLEELLKYLEQSDVLVKLYRDTEITWAEQTKDLAQHSEKRTKLDALFSSKLKKIIDRIAVIAGENINQFTEHLKGCPRLAYEVALTVLDNIESPAPLELTPKTTAQVNASLAQAILNFIKVRNYAQINTDNATYNGNLINRFGQSDSPLRQKFYRYSINALCNTVDKPELTLELLNSYHDFFDLPHEFIHLLNEAFNLNAQLIPGMLEWAKQAECNANAIMQFLAYNRVSDTNFQKKLQPLFDALTFEQLQTLFTLAFGPFYHELMLPLTQESNQCGAIQHYLNQANLLTEFNPGMTSFEVSLQAIACQLRSSNLESITEKFGLFKNFSPEAKALILSRLLTHLSDSPQKKCLLLHSFIENYYDNSCTQQHQVVKKFLDKMLTNHALSGSNIGELLALEVIDVEYLVDYLARNYNAPSPHKLQILAQLALVNDELTQKLLHYKNLPQQIIPELLKQLNDKNLIHLIKTLKSKAKNNPFQFNQLLYQASLKEFSQRLKNTNNSNLHETINSDFLNSGIAFDCMNQAEICYDLTRLQSTPAAYLTDSLWSFAGYDSNTEVELKHRIIKFLNYPEYSLEQIQSIVLNLFITYQARLDKLYHFINNIHRASRLLKKHDEPSEQAFFGQTNYRLIKQSIHTLITPNIEYDEQTFWQQFHAYCRRTSHSDIALSNISKQVLDTDNAAIAALYFSRIEDIGTLLQSNEESPLKSWSIEQTIQLLLHSGEKTLHKNWELCATLLNHQFNQVEQQLFFIQNVFEKMAETSQLQSMNAQVVSLILKLSQFEQCLPKLTHQQRLFLIKNTKNKNAIDIASWVDILNSKAPSSRAQIPELLQYYYSSNLDVTEEDLISVYSCYLKTSTQCAYAFTHIDDNAPNPITHYLAIKTLVNQKESEEPGFIFDFLPALFPLVQTHHRTPIVLSIIKQLITEITELNPDEPTHLNTVNHYLALLAQIHPQNQTSAKHHEIEQIFNQFIDNLYQKNPKWTQALLSAYSLKSFLHLYLNNHELNPNYLYHHPLFLLLIEHSGSVDNLDETIKQTHGYYEFIKHVLTHSEIQLTYFQSMSLFQSLSSIKQKNMALELLTDTQFNVSEDKFYLLLVLSASMDKEQLYQLFLQKNKHPLFIKLIVYHPNAFLNLTENQLTVLISQLKPENSDKIIFDVLTDNINPAIKNKFIEALLNGLNPLEENFNHWIEKNRISGDTFILMLNHLPIRSIFYDAIKALVANKKSYALKFKLERFLQTGLEGITIHKESLLYELLAQAYLDSPKKAPPSINLLTQLNPDDCDQVFKRAYSFFIKEQAALNTLVPVASWSNNCADEIIVAARFNNQLSLLNLLFKIRGNYLEDTHGLSETIASCGLIESFRSFFEEGLDFDPHLAGSLYNDLNKAIESYINTIKQLLSNKPELRQYLEDLESFYAAYQLNLKLVTQKAPAFSGYKLIPGNDFCRYDRGSGAFRALSKESREEFQSNIQEFDCIPDKSPDLNRLCSMIDNLLSKPNYHIAPNTQEFICQYLLTSIIKYKLNQEQIDLLYRFLPKTILPKVIGFYKNQIHSYFRLKDITARIRQRNSIDIENADSISQVAELLLEHCSLVELQHINELALNANAPHFNQFLEILITVKTSSETDYSNHDLLLNSLLGAHNGFTCEWLNQDLNLMQNYGLQNEYCLNELYLSYYKLSLGKPDNSTLDSLSKINSLSQIHFETIVNIVNSYAAYYRKVPKDISFPRYKKGLLKLLKLISPHQKARFLQALDKDLFNQIITTSIDELDSFDPTLRTTANQCLNQLLDCALSDFNSNKKLINQLKNQLDRAHASKYESAIKAIGNAIPTSTDSEYSLEQHTLDGIWIQRLLSSPESFIHLTEVKTQGLIERYRALSKLLKHDEFEQWEARTQNQLQLLYQDLAECEPKLHSIQADISLLYQQIKKTPKEKLKPLKSTLTGLQQILEEQQQKKAEITNKIASFGKKKQHLLAFKSDIVIQELFRQLQQSIEAYRAFSNGYQGQFAANIPEHITQEEARNIAQAAATRLGNYQAKILSEARDSHYQNLVDDLFLYLMEDKGDLTSDRSFFWRCAKQIFSPSDPMVLNIKKKKKLLPDHEIYDSNGHLLGKIDSNLLILNGNGQSILFKEHVFVGMPLFDHEQQCIGSLSIKGGVCAQNHFIGEASVNILNQQPLSKLKKIPHVRHLIRDMITEGQIDNLFFYLSLNAKIYPDIKEKFDWLKNNIKQILSNDSAPLFTQEDAACLSKHYSFDELHAILLHASKENKATLLEHMVENEALCLSIGANPSAQSIFFKWVNHAEFSSQQLFKLCHTAETSTVKQLLLAGLLAHPQDLNPDSHMEIGINQLNLSLFSLETIRQFPEKLSLQLLLTCHTYHHASQNKFTALYRNLSHKKNFIHHFLKHQSTLPLFEQGLLKLIITDKQKVFESIAELPGEHKSRILQKILDSSQIIQHLVEKYGGNKTGVKHWSENAKALWEAISNQFNTQLPDLFHKLFHKEDLIYAINTYLNQSDLSHNYLSLLAYLVEKNINTIITQDSQSDWSQHLTHDELNSLLALNHHKKFKTLYSKPLLKQEHYNQLFRKTALTGNASIFYLQGSFSIEQASRQIEQNLFSSTKAYGVVSRFSHDLTTKIGSFDWNQLCLRSVDAARSIGSQFIKLKWEHLKRKPQSESTPSKSFDWNQFSQQTLSSLRDKPLEYLAEFRGQVKGIDLFLSECPFLSPEVKRLLDDYLHYYETQLDVTPLTSCAELLLSPGVSQTIKDAISMAFIRHPELLMRNTALSHTLYRYMNKALITHYGQQGQYTEVIHICRHLQETVLDETKLLDITKAKQEATFEQILSQRTYFAGIRNWFSRLFFYGFRGFFKLNRPEHVISFEQKEPPPPILRNNVYVDELSVPEPELSQSLSSFDFSKHPDKHKIEPLLERINAYRSGDSGIEEQLTVREHIDAFYERLKQYCSEEPPLKASILTKKNQDLFTENRSQLIGCYLQDDNRIELNQLLDKLEQERQQEPQAAARLNALLKQFEPRDKPFYSQQQTEVASNPFKPRVKALSLTP